MAADADSLRLPGTGATGADTACTEATDADVAGADNASADIAGI